MKSTDQLVLSFLLYGECAKELGERLANDAAIRWLINSPRNENNKELFRIWLQNNIASPKPAIESELQNWLNLRQFEKALSHGEPVHKELRKSFKNRLTLIASI